MATDGWEVVVLRVTSGAPEPGGSYAENAMPCPSYESPPLPLLRGEWDFATASGVLPQAPPAGFVALARVLCADADGLVGTAPLTSVLADLAADEAAPAEAAVQLRLDARLGCGGSADAYAVAADVPQAGAGAVLKLARGAAEDLVRAFAAEEDALRTLAGAPGVPRMLRAGRRADMRWPMLLTSPLGAPLAAELAARLGAACAAGAQAADARRAFADEVLSGVHAALRARRGPRALRRAAAQLRRRRRRTAAGGLGPLARRGRRRERLRRRAVCAGRGVWCARQLRRAAVARPCLRGAAVGRRRVRPRPQLRSALARAQQR